MNFLRGVLPPTKKCEGEAGPNLVNNNSGNSAPQPVHYSLPITYSRTAVGAHFTRESTRGMLLSRAAIAQLHSCATLTASIHQRAVGLQYRKLFRILLAFTSLLKCRNETSSKQRIRYQSCFRRKFRFNFSNCTFFQAPIIKQTTGFCAFGHQHTFPATKCSATGSSPETLIRGWFRY